MSLRRLVQTDSYTSGYLHQRYFQEFWQGQIVVIMDKSLTKFRFWLCFLQVSLSLSIFLVIQETGELENKAFIYNLYEIHAHKEHHAHTVEDLWGEGTPVWTRRNQSINNAVHYLLGTQYHILIFLLWEKQVFCVILWSNLITKWHISKDCWSTFNSFLLCLCISQYHMYFLQWMSVFSPPRRQKLTWRLKWLWLHGANSPPPFSPKCSTAAPAGRREAQRPSCHIISGRCRSEIICQIKYVWVN